MRRLVRDHILTAIDRAKPQLERFVAGPRFGPKVLRVDVFKPRTPYQDDCREDKR